MKIFFIGSVKFSGSVLIKLIDLNADLIGVATLGCGWVIGNPLAPLFAEPTGLIITLFGCLMLLVAGYAWLVFDGGLQDVDEEE